MKRNLLLFFLLASAMMLSAQNNLAVKSFRALPNDMTASSREGRRIDQNGEVAALIRVVTTETGFTFEGGSLGIVDTKQRVSEIWVWVPHGLRRISIFHPQLGVLRDYVFPMEIEAERTYEMVLLSGQVETVVRPTVTQQFLVIRVTPKDAMVTVDGMPWPVIDGVAQKMVDFGRYEYRVEALDYHASAGKVDVNDADNKAVVEVVLRPAYGFLKIEGDQNLLSQASVYIDNANGTEALRSAMRLASGQHKVRVVHPKYKPFEQTVTVTDAETSTVHVDLNVNFATVTLQVDADAEIWVNGERKGVRSWTGELVAGNYTVECRQENHQKTVQRMTVTAEMSGQTFQLEAPKPIVGRLVVSTTPADATLIIDGKRVGETPMQLNSIMVGQHSVRVEKKGWLPLTKSIVIEENKTLNLEETLQADGSNKPVTTVDEPVKPAEPQALPAANKAPKRYFATINMAYSPAPQLSFGSGFGMLGKVGWFLTAMSNFNFKALDAKLECDADGYVEGEYPVYSGEVERTRISVMGGVLIKVADPLYARVGIGYGMRECSLWTVDGTLVRSSSDCVKGVDASAGAQLVFGSFTFSLDLVTTNFKTMEAKIGLGLAF